MNPPTEILPTQSPPDDIRIREATVQDLAFIVHHRRAIFEELGHTDRAALERMQEASARFFGAALAEGSYRAWLAESSEGRVIAGGGVAVTPQTPKPHDPKPDCATILNVYTEPGFRHRGIARRLTLVMIDWCRKAEFALLNLHASDGGRPLYAALGFVPTNEMRLTLKSPAK